MTAQPALIVCMGASGCGKSTVGLGIAKALGLPFIDGDDLHPANNVAKMSAGQPLTDEDRIPWLHKVRETAVLLTSSAGLEALDNPTAPETVDEAEDRAVEHELHAALQRIHPESLAARLEKRTGSDGQGKRPRQREAIVVACSALTIQYRNLLRGEEAKFQLPDGREITSEKKLEPHIETFFVYLQGTRTLLLNRMQHRQGHFMKAGMLDSQLSTLQEPHETGEANISVVKLGTGADEATERGKAAVIDEAVEKMRSKLGA